MSDHESMSMGIARLAAAGCLTVLTWVASPDAAAPSYDFADAAYLAPASSLPDWADTVERNDLEQRTIAECLADESVCQSRLIGIRHLLTKAQSLPIEKQIRLVNRYVNKRRYRDDRSVRDYHAVLAVRSAPGSTWLLESDNTIQRGGAWGYRYVFAINEDSIWDHEGADG